MNMIGELLIGLATAVGRSLGGWAKNSLKDGVIQKVEWERLPVSLIATSIVFVGAYFSIPLFLESDALEWISSAVSFVISPLIEAGWQKYFNKE